MTLILISVGGMAMIALGLYLLISSRDPKPARPMTADEVRADLMLQTIHHRWVTDHLRFQTKLRADEQLRRWRNGDWTPPNPPFPGA